MNTPGFTAEAALKESGNNGFYRGHLLQLDKAALIPQSDIEGFLRCIARCGGTSCVHHMLLPTAF